MFTYYYHARDRFYTRTIDAHPFDHVFVVGDADESHIWPHWQHGAAEGYDGDCAACWLNITHSREYHARGLTDV
jgi:hypothetical protein